MFSFFKINLRQITTVFLLSAALFFGVAFGNMSAVAAESITRDVSNLNTGDVVSDQEYEMDKASRQQEQAMRSAMATPEQENESISEKLNLDEALPRSTKKFIDQIKGDEPIDNETHP